jgi:hypothetical protein
MVVRVKRGGRPGEAGAGMGMPNDPRGKHPECRLHPPPGSHARSASRHAPPGHSSHDRDDRDDDQVDEQEEEDGHADGAQNTLDVAARPVRSQDLASDVASDEQYHCPDDYLPGWAEEPPAPVLVHSMVPFLSDLSVCIESNLLHR